MSTTIAEQLVENPTPELEQIAADVQAVANDTQSYAYRFEDQEDGSRVEVRAAAVPRIATPGRLPEADARLEGALAKTPEGLFRLLPHNPDGSPNGLGQTHGWVRADSRTREFHEELTPGTPAFIAHPAT